MVNGSELYGVITLTPRRLQNKKNEWNAIFRFDEAYLHNGERGLKERNKSKIECKKHELLFECKRCFIYESKKL
jgi:hypothetical protein